MMKRIFTALLCALCITANAQTAKQVLDKASASISNAKGTQANFTMNSKTLGNVSGTIAIKKQKFHAVTPKAIVWFDGKTQWTLMRSNNEVNVSNPSVNQLQSLNPYSFINLYRKGYKMQMTTTKDDYNVHLTSTQKNKKISEMYIVVKKGSYAVSQVKMLMGGKWSTISISNITHKSLGDGAFRFNSKDFPTAEVIDLR